MQVSVFGSSRPTEEEYRTAYEVGRLLGKAGAVVVCGGLGGVMEAVCRGAKETGGLTVGILPGAYKQDANRWVDVVVPSGLGEARNALVALSGDVAIAIGGGLGTLSEVALALRNGVPVVAVFGWKLERTRLGGVKYIEARDADEAVRVALETGLKGEEDFV